VADFVCKESIEGNSFMPCYHPVEYWVHQSKKTDNGKNLLLFSYNPKFCAGPTPDGHVACGRCIGCRLAKSREWAVRCMHEAASHEDNCWLTLTMSDEYLWSNARAGNPYSLQRGKSSEMTRFIMRLRKKFGEGIRYLYCGEYGETCFYCNKSEKACYQHGCGEFLPWRGRPHYHMCLFGLDFFDKRYLKSINGCKHYNSETLNKLWTDPRSDIFMGHVTISDLTVDSAAYTARYSLKKVTGDLADEINGETGLKHYQRVSPDGEVFDLVPEFVSMSNRSGIGADWFDKWYKEVMDNDSVLFKECRIKPPRYYDKKLENINAQRLEENKIERVDKAIDNPDNTPERLEVREYIAQQAIKKLHRKEC
jgi:hypothetical protein